MDVSKDDVRTTGSKTNISLNGCVSENYGTKHFLKMFADRGWSLNGLKTISVKLVWDI